MWQSFKNKVSDHSEEIVAGAVVVGTIAIYAGFCTLVYKAAKQEAEVKKAQVALLKNAVALQERELNVQMN
jgi:hypothetical protein